MPNYQILKPVFDINGVDDIEKDAPKMFTNIDNEPFEFTWDGKPFGGMFPDRMKPTTETIINSEGKPELKINYEFVKPILVGETVTMPKYLVNYAAMHLARKIYKRQAFAAFQGTELERRNAAIRFVNPEEEIKLMKKMVAANFPEEKVEEPKAPTPENVIDKTQIAEPPKEEPKPETPKMKYNCEQCDFVGKNVNGLRLHMRKHNK